MKKEARKYCIFSFKLEKMQVVKDVFGRAVRVTDERIQHLTENHPEMENALDQIIKTLQHPEKVVESVSDASVELFYHFYIQTFIGDKWLYVVVCKELKC